MHPGKGCNKSTRRIHSAPQASPPHLSGHSRTSETTPRLTRVKDEWMRVTGFDRQSGCEGDEVVRLGGVLDKAGTQLPTSSGWILWAKSYSVTDYPIGLAAFSSGSWAPGTLVLGEIGRCNGELSLRTGCMAFGENARGCHAPARLPGELLAWRNNNSTFQQTVDGERERVSE